MLPVVPGPAPAGGPEGQAVQGGAHAGAALPLPLETLAQPGLHSPTSGPGQDHSARTGSGHPSKLSKKLTLNEKRSVFPPNYKKCSIKFDVLRFFSVQIGLSKKCVKKDFMSPFLTV